MGWLHTIKRWWRSLFRVEAPPPEKTQAVRTEQVTCLVFQGRQVFKFYLQLEVYNHSGVEVVWFRGKYRTLKRTDRGYRVLMQVLPGDRQGIL